MPSIASFGFETDRAFTVPPEPPDYVPPRRAADAARSVNRSGLIKKTPQTTAWWSH
jgi:hypothetical protein